MVDLKARDKWVSKEIKKLIKELKSKPVNNRGPYYIPDEYLND